MSFSFLSRRNRDTTALTDTEIKERIIRSLSNLHNQLDRITIWDERFSNDTLTDMVFKLKQFEKQIEKSVAIKYFNILLTAKTERLLELVLVDTNMRTRYNFEIHYYDIGKVIYILNNFHPLINSNYMVYLLESATLDNVKSGHFCHTDIF